MFQMLRTSLHKPAAQLRWPGRCTIALISSVICDIFRFPLLFDRIFSKDAQNLLRKETRSLHPLTAVPVPLLKLGNCLLGVWSLCFFIELTGLTEADKLLNLSQYIIIFYLHQSASYNSHYRQKMTSVPSDTTSDPASFFQYSSPQVT